MIKKLLKTLKEVVTYSAVLGGRKCLMGIRYDKLIETRSYLDKLPDTFINRLIRKYANDQFTKIKEQLVHKHINKPQELMDFVNFYMATKDYIKQDTIHCTVSARGFKGIDTRSSKDIQYFSITVDNPYAQYYKEIRISTDPICAPNMLIKVTKGDRHNDKIEHSYEYKRMFLDTTESLDHEVFWFEIVNYIDKFMFQELD